jgi:hypothetical protein
MLPTIRHHMISTAALTPAAPGVRRCGSIVHAVVLGMALSGCGLGALPSSNNGPVTGSLAAAHGPAVAAASTGIDEIHSTTCPGLEIERQERSRRIATLQVAVAAELKNLPATVAQVVHRVSDTPEEGTVAYGEILAERTLLASNASAAARLGCPPTSAGDGGKPAP